MRADRAVGQIEALPDFPVRKALRGELCDLKFLGGQLVACGWVAPAARLSRRSQFDARLVGPGCASHCFERGAGVSQRCSRFRDAALAPKPLSVAQEKTRALQRPVRVVGMQRLVESGCSVLVVLGTQRPRVQQPEPDAGSGAVARGRLDLLDA